MAALVPGGAHTATSPGHVQLTAWTVTKLADGDIYVQIRQLSDPAAVQARLRADGLRASVTFDSQPNPHAVRTRRTRPCSSGSSRRRTSQGRRLRRTASS